MVEQTLNDTEKMSGQQQRNCKLAVRDLSIGYGSETAISGINLEIYENEIFGIIGPANAGKTSFLKTLNLMNTFDSNMQVQGVKVALVLCARLAVGRWQGFKAPKYVPSSRA